MKAWLWVALIVGCIDLAVAQMSHDFHLLAKKWPIILSDGSVIEDPEDQHLRLETKPGALQDNGEPIHWLYTKPTRRLRVMVMRVRFSDAIANGIANITMEGSLNQTLRGSRLFFLDSSWGLVDYDFVVAPITDLPKTAAESDTNSIRADSLEETKKQHGLQSCWGPCGTALASSEFQSPEFATNASVFDMAVVAFRWQGTDSGGWSGLATLGNPFTWIKMDSSSYILSHEIGHNLGINHPQSAKIREGDNTLFNHRSGADYSTMSLGGTVNIDDPESRYNNNGHFSPAHKHWFGWLQDSDVAFLHPDGASHPDCSACQTTFTGKINAFDRPDVAPGMEPTPYFAIKIPIRKTEHDGGKEEAMYISYRSSHPDTRGGVSIQWCWRNFDSSLDARMASNCYTFDAWGDTYDLDDKTVPPGHIYVAHPAWNLIDRAGYTTAMRAVPVITVTSVPDFSDCTNMVCPDGKEIAVELSVRFLTAEEKAMRIGVNPNAARTSNVAPGKPTTLRISGGGRALIVAEDGAQGPQGYGDFNVSVCPSGQAATATVFYYDHFPFAATRLGQPLGFGASISKTISQLECCSPGDTVAVLGVRALVVRQNLAESINFREIEVYAKADPATNIAPSATCYMLPSVGSPWYNGNLGTGVTSQLNDGNHGSYADSGASGGAGVDFMMCVLAETTELHSVKLYPLSSANNVRNTNLTLTLYAAVTPDDTPEMATEKPLQELWRTEVVHASGVNWDAGEEYIVPANLPTSMQCPQDVPKASQYVYPAVHGKAYAVVDIGSAGSVDVRSSVSFHTCPDDPASNSAEVVDTVQRVEANGDLSCVVCPQEPVLDLGGCPVKGRQCLAFQGEDGLFSPVEGTSPRRYKGAGQAGIEYNAAAMQWEMTRADGVLVATKKSALLSEAWKATGAGSGAGGYQGVTAVTVTMLSDGQVDDDEILNFCELQVLDLDGVNVAPQATCYQLPHPQGNWYSAGADGLETNANDDNFGTCIHSGDPAAEGKMLACVFPAPVKVGNISLFPRTTEASHPPRSDYLNITFYTSPITDSPPTEASFAVPYAARLAYQDMSAVPSASREICQLKFAPAWATRADILGDDCNENRSWTDLGRMEVNDRMRTGGLGKLMQPGRYETWACIFDSPCAHAHAPSAPPADVAEAFVGPDGVVGTSDDRPWGDWTCYVYAEDAMVFEPWGFNSHLRLFSPAAMPMA